MTTARKIYLNLKLVFFFLCPLVVVCLLYTAVTAQTIAQSPTYQKLTDPLYFWVLAFMALFGILGVSIGRNIAKVDEQVKALWKRDEKLEGKISEMTVAMAVLGTNCKNNHK